MKFKLSEIIKQRGIADVARGIGVHPVSISEWLSGRYLPSLKTLDKLCMFLGCGIADLLEPEEVDLPDLAQILDEKIDKLKKQLAEIESLKKGGRK